MDDKEVELIEHPDGRKEVMLYGDLAEEFTKRAAERGITEQELFEAAVRNYIEENK